MTDLEEFLNRLRSLSDSQLVDELYRERCARKIALGRDADAAYFRVMLVELVMSGRKNIDLLMQEFYLRYPR